MDSSYIVIQNYEALVKVLGQWPSFDDFEVVSMLLKRSHEDAEWWNNLTVEFFGYRHDVPPESPDISNCLIVLQFGQLENMTLYGFNHQNAINGFQIRTNWSEHHKQNIHAVHIIQGFGVGAEFDCALIELLSVTPTTPRSKIVGQ